MWPVLKNCGWELVRRTVVLSWYLDMQQVHAVIFYRSTDPPQQKLRIFVRAVIIQGTLLKELSQCRCWRSSLTHLRVLHLVVTDYTK